MPAKYVLSKNGTSYHWNLLATNGRVIASSERYNTKAAAMAGIRSVQKNGPTDVVVTEEELAAARKPAKAAKKATADKAPAEKSAAKKSAAKKSPAKRSSARKAATTG